MGTPIETTLVTEAYNLAEGMGYAELEAAVAAVMGVAAKQPGVEPLLIDGSDDARVVALVARHAGLRHVPVPGANYDALKNAAATAAHGRFIAYLDGDCRPLADDWLDRLLAPIRAGEAVATAGTTFYDDRTPTGIACSIMDWGFLWDDPGGAVGCYSSNNVAFEREMRCAIPAPDGKLRCNCYLHTQQMARRGIRVRHVADAIVVHQLPDLDKERPRRARDLVGACWNDPLLRETAWLADPATAPLRFLDDIVQADAQRFHTAPKALGLTDANRDAVAQEIMRLRELDLDALRAAVAEGERSGENAAAVAAHRAWLDARRSVGA
ncbi:MAG TPA: glycosyltransferase [Xanthomonadales bacterium]|nr:glycosyltransferase [Xanthomonadales bacterium]